MQYLKKQIPARKKPLSDFFTAADLPNLSESQLQSSDYQQDVMLQEEPKLLGRRNTLLIRKSNNSLRRLARISENQPDLIVTDPLRLLKMTEQCIDNVPADLLDVGSCSTPPRVESPVSENMDQSQYEGVNIASSSSTSLFNVFEERLTSYRKADDCRMLLMPDNIQHSDSFYANKFDQLRRSKTGIQNDRHSSRQLEKGGSLRRLLLRRPFTVNAGRGAGGLNAFIERLNQIQAPSTTPPASLLQKSAAFSSQGSICMQSSSLSSSKPSSVKDFKIGNSLKRAATVKKSSANMSSRPQSTDSGYLSMKTRPSHETLRKVNSIESMNLDDNVQTQLSAANQTAALDTAQIVARTSPVSPKRRNVQSMIEEAQSLEVPLIEEMGANCKRVILAGDLSLLIDILINPIADQFYDNYTSDFMLSYRYYMTEQDMFDRLRCKFDEWSARALGYWIKEETSLMAKYSDAEARIGRLWILPEDEPVEVLIRILTLLTDWIEQYSYLDYFAKSPMSEVGRHQNLELLNDISSFMEQKIYCHKLKQVRLWSGPLKVAIKKKFDAYGFQVSIMINDSGEISDMRSRTMPILNRPRKGTNPEKTHASLLSLKAEDLFQQLTLIEMDYFLAIRPLDLYYKSKGQLNKATKLADLIVHFNDVSYWVATEICMCRNVRMRAEVIKLFLKVAKLCFKWHNYNTCLQIIAALSMTCVRRLKKTWRLLPRRYELAWRELSRLFSASCNYSTYRQDVLAKLEVDDASSLLSEANMRENLEYHNYDPKEMHGGIPFMGVHLSDLVFIEEAHGKDILNGTSLINFTKMRLIAKTFRQFVHLQKITSYSALFKVEPFTRRFLQHDTFALDEDKLWKASKIIEPADDFFDEPINVSTLLSV